MDSHCKLTDSHLLEDVSQFLHVVLVVLLTILPGREGLLVLLHIRLPNVHKVRRLHHPQLAAGARQGPEPLDHLGLLPLKETGAEYAETELFALLEDAGQLGCTRHTGTGRDVPRDVVLLGGVGQHLGRKGKKVKQPVPSWGFYTTDEYKGQALEKKIRGNICFIYLTFRD